MRSFSQPGRLCSNYRVYRCGTRQELGEEKIITACLNIDIHTHHITTPRHLDLLNTINTITICTALITTLIKKGQTYIVHVALCCGDPFLPRRVHCKGLIYFSYICCLSCQMLVVLVTVWSESQLYLLFTGGEGGGSVVSPSIGESQLTKLTR